MSRRLLLALLFLPCAIEAHTIPYELEQLRGDQVFGKYVAVGFEHIIPLGFDHILFIVCVFFLNSRLRQIVWQASMFTLAHSLTLALAAYGVITPNPKLVEPLIAFSIFLLAVENVLTDKVRAWRMASVFGFGLIHGLGFAGALAQLGLPRYAFATALVGFNIGVELGQLSIILAMYFLLARLFGAKSWYRSRVVIPASLVMAGVALAWTLQRIFFP